MEMYLELIDYKKCCKCKRTLSVSLFWKCKRYKDGLQQKCKECLTSYFEGKKEKISSYKKEWAEKNKDKIKQRSIDYYRNNKELIKKKVKIYAEKNKEKIRKANRKYEEKNAEKIKKSRQRYRDNNKDKIKESNKLYFKNNELAKLRHSLRTRVRIALKHNKYIKNTKTFSLLGAEASFVRKYLERKFTRGMSWNNYGKGPDKWHIDHIIPLASAKNEEDLKTLFHYTNLQPLWEKDNLAKNKKIPEVQLKITL